jgi:hypothetical protein
LRDYAATATKWSFGLCVNIVQAVTRRREQMARHHDQVAGGSASPQTAMDHEQEVKRLSERVRQCLGVHLRRDASCTELGAGSHSATGTAP